MASHPSPGNCAKIVPSGKRKISFLQWNLTGYINCTLGQTPGPGVVGQYTTKSLVILLNFCLILLWGAIFFLISLLLVYFIYVFVVSCMFLKTDRQIK